MVEGHVPKGVWVQLPPSALHAAEERLFYLVDWKTDRPENLPFPDVLRDNK